VIFVTVGGMHGFERLVREMDRIAGAIDEPVVMQIGSTDYEPANCDYHRFMPVDEIEKLYAAARVVVCHPGIGTILTALEHRKLLVLVPRMKKYGEHIDDHQLDIARQMEAHGLTPVYDIADLESAIRNAGTSMPALSTGGDLAARLKEYLDRLEDRS